MQGNSKDSSILGGDQSAQVKTAEDTWENCFKKMAERDSLKDINVLK